MKTEEDIHRAINFRLEHSIRVFLEEDSLNPKIFLDALDKYLMKVGHTMNEGITATSFLFKLNMPILNDKLMEYCSTWSSAQLLIDVFEELGTFKPNLIFNIPINQMRYACMTGDLTSVQNLINEQKNIKVNELVDYSCFKISFQKKSIDILKVLIEFRSFEFDIEITEQLFNVCLPIDKDFLISVKFLTDLQNLKPNQVQEFIDIHFYNGSITGNLWKIKKLLSELPSYFNHKMIFEESLKTASECGHLSIIEYLLSQNDLKERLGYSITHMNNRCIIYAAKSKNLHIVKYIENLGDSDVNLLDDSFIVFSNRNNPFSNYAEKGLKEIIDYIIESPKYSVLITDDMVYNGYLAACCGGHLSLAVKILRLRSNLNSSEELHNKAFIAACTNGHPDVVKYLLEKEDCAIDYCAENKAAFLGAVRNRNLVVTQMLLQNKKANIDYTHNNDEAFRMVCADNAPVAISLINMFLELRQPEVNYNANNGQPLCNVIRHHNLINISTLLNLPNINPSLNNFEALKLALQVGLPTAVNGIVAWAFRNGYQREVRVIIEEANTLRPRNFQINYPQSIHAVSVHHSVSQSALKLKSSYGNQIDTDEKLCVVIQKLQVEVSKFEASEKGLTPLMVSAAKRYIANADNPDVFSRFRFKDLISQLTTQEVIALSYIAALDSTRLLPGCDDKDAITSLVRCFYEAQRGYNIGEDEQDDNNAHDNTICTSGCFNKAIEALNGIHQDVEIVVVTLTQATLKLRKVVEHCTMAYIAQIEKEDVLKAKQLVELIAADGVVVIWPTIKPNVLGAMHEFAEYLSQGDLSSFGLLIESGIDIGTTAILKQYWLKARVREQALLLIEHGKVSEQVLLSVRADDLGELWDIIKPIIEDKVFEKTKEEFPKGREHIEFIHFINKGRMVDLTDLVRKPNAAVTFSQSLKSDEGLASGEMQLRVDETMTPDSQTLNSPVGP